jgi:hypothetical protein
MERTHQTVELVDSLPICTYIFVNSRRHCRQAVAKLGDPFCATHARSHALVTPANDPLAELVTELGDASEIQQVSRFLAKVLKLACQNRISVRRAAALTYIANSLLNSIRLINAATRFVSQPRRPLPILLLSRHPREAQRE